MTKLGLPYMGSKSIIAPKIVSVLPRAETFVDLFFGGGAMTHCAMLSRKYRRFVANDIQKGNVTLFMDAVHGKYRDCKRWVSREEFFAKKDTDPFVRMCWSFGNDNRTYLYGKDVEPYKRACHYAVVLDEWDEFRRLCPEVCDAARNALDGITDTKKRRLAFGPAIVKKLRSIATPETMRANPLYAQVRGSARLESLQSLESLESLERLERLQSLESLERLERLQSLESLQSLERLQSLQSLQSLERLERLQSLETDYREVPIPEGSVVYCDPPYSGTNDYGMDFDHDAFWEWARTREFPVWVSEYSAPDDFVCVKEIPVRSRMSATTNIAATERLFVHGRFA